MLLGFLGDCFQILSFLFKKLKALTDMKRSNAVVGLRIEYCQNVNVTGMRTLKHPDSFCQNAREGEAWLLCTHLVRISILADVFKLCKIFIFSMWMWPLLLIFSHTQLSIDIQRQINDSYLKITVWFIVNILMTNSG